MDSAPSPLGRFAAVWGVGGVAVLLAHAIHGVGAVAVEAFDEPLTASQGAFCVAWIAFMAWSEGYRGFQLRFAPRTIVRAAALARRPTPLRVLLAPAFCIGYFAGTRTRLITAWGVTAAIVGVVCVVRAIPQPWRGLVDAGVVVGLGWGLIAMLVIAARALAGKPPVMDPQLPEGG